MGVNRLKVVIPNPKMNALCARDCNPSLNPHRIRDGSCFQKIYPLHCQIFSFPQGSLPPIPPLIIHDPVTQTRSTTQTHIVLIIISITASLLVSAIICILLYFLKKLRREERERPPPVFFGTQQDYIDEDQRPGVEHHYWYINTVGLQQSVIDSIAVFMYKKDGMLIEGTDCSVCLGEFQEDDSLKLLPKCSHAFHVSCIDTWLRSHKNCPLCRAPIVSSNFGARELSLASTPTSSNEGEVESSEARNEGNLVEQGDETKCTNLENKLSISSVTSSESLDLSLNIETDSAARSQSQRLQLKDSRRPSFGSVSCGKLMKSASVGLVLEKGPISVKRLFSSTAKYPTYSLSMRHSESLPL